MQAGSTVASRTFRRLAEFGSWPTVSVVAHTPSSFGGDAGTWDLLAGNLPSDTLEIRLVRYRAVRGELVDEGWELLSQMIGDLARVQSDRVLQSLFHVKW